MRSYQAAVMAVAVALSAGALAQGRDVQGDFNLVARAGISTYTGDVGPFAGAGPAWAVGFNLQPVNVLGLDIAYEGSRNRVDDGRLATNSGFFRNGASLMVRLAPPFMEQVRPYVGAGLGLSHVNVDEDEVQGLYQDDFMAEAPVAAGLELNTGPLTAGLRATYRWLIDEDFANQALPAGNQEGGLFDASVTVGGRF